MGGSVSAGVDNNDLVDNLLAEDYIKTPSVERVFRAVDRGMYFTPSGRESAYKDLAWKSGNIHLSAPCIYCEVMENLSLAPGMSFLNLGSGTGYLSTMAGLILGSNGINHGVEIHEDVIHYAHEKLEEFKKTATAIEEYDFCEPKFVQGNCLQLDACSMKYDRVYCGAACTPSYENYMKKLLKIGGVLVIPLRDRLLRIRRTSEKNWDLRSVLPVAFANLIEPTLSAVVVLPSVEPISLMDTCRTTIRCILKTAVEFENPELRVPLQPKSKIKKRTLQHLFIPMFEDGESERVAVVANRRSRVLDADSDDNSVNSSRGELSNSDGSNRPSGDDPMWSGDDPMWVNCGRFRLRDDALSSDADSDAPSDSSSSNSLTSIHQVQRALLRAMTTYESGASADPLEEQVPPPMSGEANSDSSAPPEDSSDSSMDVDPSAQEKLKAGSSKSKRKSDEGMTSKRGQTKRKEAEMENDDPSQSDCVRVQRSIHVNSSMNNESTEDKQTQTRKRRGAKREKVDSGIGEDIAALGTWDISTSDMGSELDLGSDSDSEEGESKSDSEDRRHVPVRNGKSGLRKERKSMTPAQERRQQETKAYIVCMRSKIQQLPLPCSIKSYINFFRDL